MTLDGSISLEHISLTMRKPSTSSQVVSTLRSMIAKANSYTLEVYAVSESAEAQEAN